MFYFFNQKTRSLIGFVSMGGNANVSIPAQHIQRDAGVPLANRLDAGEAITVTMIRPFVADKDSALDNTIIAHEYAHFLTNRLVLFAPGRGGRLLRAPVEHAAWPLQPARASVEVNSMAAWLGLALQGAPRLLFARHLDVRVGAPRPAV